MGAKIDRLAFERRLWNQGFQRVIGLDEVGRGCLSGPVVAGGVIFSPGTAIPGIRDSKKLSAGMREELAGVIRERALFWTIRSCDPDEIDRLNILKASAVAMMRCVESDGADPDYLLVDGNRFPSAMIPCECIVQGDDRSLSIAAASILAKVFRDRLMKRLHEEFPYYGWDTNAGYPTRAHYEGLRQHGFTKYHRNSFKLRTKRVFGSD